MTAHPGAPAVYVHVGEPKCGTSYLQDILWRNRGELARQGVRLPGLHRQEQFRATQDLRGVRQPAGDPAGSWKGEWDVLARQAAHARPVAVISHELLAGATAEQAARAVRSLAPAQVHVVLSVRDFATLLPAEWQETVKHRNQRPWEGWLADITASPARARGRSRWFWQAHDTLAVLSRWSRLLPPEQVHVITVPRAGAAPTLLWERFASVVGVDPPSIQAPPTRSNASLGLVEVELLRRLNRTLTGELPAWFYAREVKERLAQKTLAARPASGRLRLPPRQERWAGERSEQVIAGLRASGYHIVGDLDELRPVVPACPGAMPGEVTDARLLDAALASMAAMLHSQYRDTVAPGRAEEPGFGGRAGVLLASYPGLKKALRELSARHPALGRLRVVAWQLTESTRGSTRGKRSRA